MSTDAIPRRRAATLADDAFTLSGAEPAPFGPADRRSGAVIDPPDGSERRTPVPFRIDTQDVSGGPLPGVVMTPAFPLRDPDRGRSDTGEPGGPRGSAGRVGSGSDAAPRTRSIAAPDARPEGRATMVAIGIDGGEDPLLSALRSTAAVTAIAARPRPEPAAPRVMTVSATAVLDRPVTSAELDPDDEGLPRGPGPAAATPPDVIDAAAAASRGSAPAGPCAETRRLADERCQLATRAREQAGVAEETLRAAQRAYDDHEGKADEAAAAADARAVRRAKDEAQMRFRAGRAGAADHDGVEAAARAWLDEINRINKEAREAGAILARERAAATEIGSRLERLSLESDAARIAAETAEAACLAARTALADCEEAAAAPVERPPAAPSRPPLGEADDEPLAAALGGGGTPRVFRLVRGDRTALTELVNALAGDDPDERRRWQAALSDLVDAILADAIEATALAFPEDHPFWGPFTLSQDRDIASALSSLGYRFDGLGGWVDERIPSQRDLSLALGYAGLDPMRIRHWPTEAEMVHLFEGVAVAADEHLASAAGDLTLGELVTMLGRRADGLAEVWNAWGRLRPLLLEER
jgi:hypothetical protein